MGLRKSNQLIRTWLPPAIVSIYRRWGGSSVYKGNYASWQEALEHSTGYDTDEIFGRVREASMKVKHGGAVFERDGVCFYTEEYNWEVLAGLMMSAAENEGELNVLDFGGALGSFYFQHRKLFSGLKNYRWGIVEQKHYIESGRNEFEDGKLKFYSSAEECIGEMPVNLVLLSSVMQYLEKPHELLETLLGENAKYVVIDRTPFIGGSTDRLVVQQVPKSIFPAKLPMWAFSMEQFQRRMNQLGYFQMACFQCAEETVGPIDFYGFIFRKEGL